MSQSVTLRSFAELADVFATDVSAADPEDPATTPSPLITIPTTSNPSPSPAEGDPGATSEAPRAETRVLPDLDAIREGLERATNALGAIAARDREERAHASRALEQYDSLVRAVEEALRVRERARRARVEAEELVRSAFSADVRAAAQRLTAPLAQAESDAAEVLAQRESAAEELGNSPDVQRLIAERAERKEGDAEAERRRAAEDASARPPEDARGLPDEAPAREPERDEALTLAEAVDGREVQARVQGAERALLFARRDLRHDAPRAVETLASLDVEGLPFPLSRQVFGEWARACSRLCKERGLLDPLRFAPTPGRGIVFARMEDGPHRVLSALGMGPSFRPGDFADEGVLSRARPLR